MAFPLDISERTTATSPPAAGNLRLLNEAGVLKTQDPNGTKQTVLTDGDSATLQAATIAALELYLPHSGAPVSYVAPVPPADVAASYTTNLAGDNNDLVFTHKTAGADGNGQKVTLLDPGGPNYELATYVDNDGKVCVDLATDGGDPGVATIPTAEAGTITVTLEEAVTGDNVAAAEATTFMVQLASFQNYLNEVITAPSQTGPTCSGGFTGAGGGVLVELSTTAGTPSSLTLVETGEDPDADVLTISAKAEFAGTWLDSKLRARVSTQVGESLDPTCTATLDIETGILSIDLALGTDAEGAPVAITAANAVLAIEAALLEWNPSWADYFTVTEAVDAPSISTFADWVYSSGGVDPVATGLDTAGDIATGLAALDGIASAVASNAAHTVADSANYPFTGAGANYAITTTASEIVTAFSDDEDPAYDAEAAAIVSVALKADNDGTGVVTALAEQELANGKDLGEDTPEVIGTPARLGRIATDGTDVWTAVKDDLDGTDAGTWVKTFTATP